MLTIRVKDGKPELRVEERNLLVLNSALFAFTPDDVTETRDKDATPDWEAVIGSNKQALDLCIHILNVIATDWEDDRDGIEVTKVIHRLTQIMESVFGHQNHEDGHL